MVTKLLIQFGGSAYGLATQLAIPEEEAQKYVDNYYERFKGIADFKKKGTESVYKKGYILMCAYSGHKMFWWDHDKWVKTKESFTKEFWDTYRDKHKGTGDAVAKEVRQHFQAASKWSRMALNSVTQGSGIVILKIAMTNFFHWIVDNDYFGKVELASLVHDESNTIFPEELKDIVPQMQSKYMEEAAALICTKVPIPAKPDVDTYWRH